MSGAVLGCGARLLTAGASLVAERGLWDLGSAVWSTGLVAPWQVGSSRTGIEPVSPAAAGGFFTTEHQGSPTIPHLTAVARPSCPSVRWTE